MHRVTSARTRTFSPSSVDALKLYYIINTFTIHALVRWIYTCMYVHCVKCDCTPATVEINYLRDFAAGVREKCDYRRFCQHAWVHDGLRWRVLIVHNAIVLFLLSSSPLPDHGWDFGFPSRPKRELNSRITEVLVNRRRLLENSSSETRVAPAAGSSGRQLACEPLCRCTAMINMFSAKILMKLKNARMEIWYI